MELEQDSSLSDDDECGGSGTALIEPLEVETVQPRAGRLRPWKVLLHNDDFNTMEDVVETIIELTSLDHMQAIERMLEAHTEGQALLVMTHREHAELLQEQFVSKSLVVTIEPE